MKQKLDRSLGLYSAITMSVGTMIGSAIFVLAGTSYEAAGPSASLAVFLAGIAAVFTAFSFAELVTFIPTAGGGYAYVRDAAEGGIVSFMTGWGFWLGYAMSCGLFALGFGNFLNYFFPFIPQMAGSFALIFYVMLTNIKGVENSGKLQNIITTGLLFLLTVYIIYGYFHLDLTYQMPYFPEGLSGTFTAVGFLYITYIGYGLITTASEEVIEPEKTIPRAIMISLLLVTVIKTGVFFVGSSIISWEQLIPGVTDTPLIDTAIQIAGEVGGAIFALAGILATVSSINTAMMAASRTSFAMSRDQLLPNIFKKINPNTKTPIFSILAATIVVIISTLIRDLEHISTVTSIFSLLGYSFVNVAVIIFRKKMPDAERTFKVPLYPLMPVVGVIVNILLVIQLMISDLPALVVAVLIIVGGILYYYFLLPKLKQAPKGFTPKPVPDLQLDSQKMELFKEECYEVLVPIAYPDTVNPLLDLGIKVAGAYNGKVLPLHIVRVPEVIPMDSRQQNFKEEMETYEGLVEGINNFADKEKYITETLSVVSRNVNAAIKNTATDIDADLVLLGWHKTGLAYRMLGGTAHKALEEIPATVGIYKDSKDKKIWRKNNLKKILYPYGGGFHSQAAAEIVKKIAETSGAEVTFLRIIEEDIPEFEYQDIKEVMEKGLRDLDVEGNIKIINNESKIEGILEVAKDNDLVVLGASSQWGVKDHLTGSATDKIMERLDSAGLVIRAYKPLMQKKQTRKILSRAKKFLLDS